MTRLARVARAGLGAVAVLGVSASVVLAHPLGNFTINHYAGVRVEPDRVLLDVVIDEAEIPAFQATSGLDTNGDGRVSDTELAGLPVSRCLEVGRSLALSVGGQPAPLTLTAAGATLPPGNGGLATLRLVCGFESAISLAAGTTIALRDDFQAARIGWREMTAVGSGTTLLTPGLLSASTSARLTAYPGSLASAPDVRELAFDVRPGGPILPDVPVPDARQVEPVTVDAGPLPATGETVTGSIPTPVVHTGAVEGPGSATVTAAVPGGAEALPDVLRQAPVSPLLALAAFVVAILLGAGHALTPGHGKTLMAAYLVGTRGTARHAVGLGLTVSVTHTAGILALAVVILAAESAFAPDLVVRVAPVVAAGSIVVVGSWMLVAELRRRRAERHHERAHELAHTPDHDHGHEHEHPHDHDHPHGHDDDHAGAHGHEHADPLEHRHGPISHRHAPPADRPALNWRGLALLGLAGGLVPSANALLILLGTIAAGRPAWGIVLVAAFGVGMAGVMTGIGLAVVLARGALDRAPRDLPLATARRFVPLAASVVVLALGIVLSAQALTAVRLG